MSEVVLTERYNQETLELARASDVLSAAEKGRLKDLLSDPVLKVKYYRYSSKYSPFSGFAEVKRWPARRMHQGVVKAALRGESVMLIEAELWLCDLCQKIDSSVKFPEGVTAPQARALFKAAGIDFGVPRTLLDPPTSVAELPTVHLRHPVTLTFDASEDPVRIVQALAEDVRPPGYRDVGGKTTATADITASWCSAIFQDALWCILSEIVGGLSADGVGTVLMTPDGLLLETAIGSAMREKITERLGRCLLPHRPWPYKDAPVFKAAPRQRKKRGGGGGATAASGVNDIASGSPFGLAAPAQFDEIKCVPTALAMVGYEGVLDRSLQWNEPYSPRAVDDLLKWRKLPHNLRQHLDKIAKDENAYAMTVQYHTGQTNRQAEDSETFAPEQRVRFMPTEIGDGPPSAVRLPPWVRHNIDSIVGGEWGNGKLVEHFAGVVQRKYHLIEPDIHPDPTRVMGMAKLPCVGYQTFPAFIRRRLACRDMRILSATGLERAICLATLHHWEAMPDDQRTNQAPFESMRNRVVMWLVDYMRSGRMSKNVKVVCPVPEGLLVRGIQQETEDALLADLTRQVYTALDGSSIHITRAAPVFLRFDVLAPLDSDPSPFRGEGAVYLEDRLIKKENLLAWQKWIWDLIESNRISDRKVYYLHEEHGKAGKSSFCLMLMHHFRICRLTGAAEDNMAMCLKADLEKHNNQLDAVIFDLPKGAPDMWLNDVLRLVECLKSEYVFSMKYRSKAMRVLPCHVFVFSNEAPADDTMHKLSEDRWFCREIKEYPPQCSTEEEVPNQHLLESYNHLDMRKLRLLSGEKEIVESDDEANQASLAIRLEHLVACRDNPHVPLALLGPLAPQVPPPPPRLICPQGDNCVCDNPSCACVGGVATTRLCSACRFVTPCEQPDRVSLADFTSSKRAKRTE